MLTAGYAERERIKQEQGKGIFFLQSWGFCFVLLLSYTVIQYYHLNEHAYIRLC